MNCARVVMYSPGDQVRSPLLDSDLSGLSDDDFIRAVLNASTSAFGEAKAASPFGGNGTTWREHLHRRLNKVLSEGRLLKYRERYCEVADRVYKAPSCCLDKMAADAAIRMHANGRYRQWIRTHVCGPAVKYAFIANALTWASFAVFPFVGYSLSFCSEGGFAEYPHWLLPTYMAVLLIPMVFEFVSFRHTFPAHIAIAGFPNILGCEIPMSVFVPGVFIMSAFAHTDLATNSLFLAKGWKTERCRSNTESVTEALRDILSDSNWGLIRHFSTVKFSTWASILYGLMFTQLAYALSSSIPLPKWLCEALSRRRRDDYDLLLKDRDFEGRFLTYTVLANDQQHHDDALVALAESGRMASVRFQAWSYVKVGAEHQRYFAGQLMSELNRSLLRCVIFTIFESTLQMNLQCTYVAIVGRMSGGQTDWQVVVSVSLSIFVAAVNFLLMWWQIQEQYESIANAPIHGGEGEENLRRMRFDIDAKRKANVRRKVFNAVVIIFVLIIMYCSFKLVMVTTVCKQGWNLKLESYDWGCVAASNATNTTNTAARSGTVEREDTRVTEIVFFACCSIIFAFFIWRDCGPKSKPQQGNLIYPVLPEDMARAGEVVERVAKGMKCREALGSECPLPVEDQPKSQKNLMVVYTDAEPDDLMAIAQLWEFKRLTEHMTSLPIVIFSMNFEEKDGGSVAEKKQLLFTLLVGLEINFVLSREGDTGAEKGRDGAVHPRASVVAAERDRTIAGICEKLASFEGEVIDFFVIAPGSGNLGAIVDRLKSQGNWPLKQKWRVMLYSGGYNMKGMRQGDILALQDIMRHSDDPLVDLGKFPFFGGKDNHPWANSLTTFVEPDFAIKLNDRKPLLAALLKSFNDEFNKGLIAPSKIFERNSLTPAQQEHFDDKIAPKYEHGTIEAYCNALMDDAELWTKVKRFKKNTIKPCAFGGCDSPLCDQLLFLYVWLKANKPEELDLKEGMWNFTLGKEFVEIKEEGMFRAMQPVLKNPHKEKALYSMRQALQDHLERHLKWLYSSRRGSCW